MPVNTEYAGRTYPANAPYEVAREKLREFADAVCATHPAHTDVDAARALGYPDVIAPPTFAVVVAQRAEAQLFTDPAAGKLVYLRNTCCLYYTSDQACGTVCGSCCLTPRPDRLTAYEAGRPILTV